MVASSLSSLTICSRCALREVQNVGRRLSTGTSTPLRAMPPRIIATENDPDHPYPQLEDVHDQQFPDADSTQLRKSKSQTLHSRDIPSTERLFKDMYGRLGRRKVPGFVEASDALENHVGTKMVSRIRLRPDSALEAQLPISPSELLHSETAVEVSEVATAAIEACISAAVNRLELYPPSRTDASKFGDKTAIPHDQYLWLSSILQFQFSKQQLVQYGIQRGLQPSRLQRARIADCISIILDEAWKFEKEPELPRGESLVTKSIQAVPDHTDFRHSDHEKREVFHDW